MINTVQDNNSKENLDSDVPSTSNHSRYIDRFNLTLNLFYTIKNVVQDLKQA